MREYSHGFCGHLRKGTEEGEKGCLLTCDMFRDMFLQVKDASKTV